MIDDSPSAAGEGPAWLPRMTAPRPGTDRPTPRLITLASPKPAATHTPAPTPAPEPSPASPPITNVDAAGGSPAAAPTPAAADNESHEEDEPMPAKPERAPRKPRTKSPQLRICQLLHEKGDLTRDEIRDGVGTDRTVTTAAIFNAKANGRLVFLESSGKYKLTKAGREWVEGKAAGAAEASAPPPKATKRKPKKAAPAKKRAPKAPKAAPSKPAPAPPPVRRARPARDLAVLGAVTVIQERSFRCAVASDGCFTLNKAGVQIDLNPAECAEMLRYLERMAEQPGA